MYTSGLCCWWFHPRCQEELEGGVREALRFEYRLEAWVVLTDFDEFTVGTVRGYVTLDVRGQTVEQRG